MAPIIHALVFGSFASSLPTHPKPISAVWRRVLPSYRGLVPLSTVQLPRSLARVSGGGATVSPGSDTTKKILTANQGRAILVFVAFLFGTLNVCFRKLLSLEDGPSVAVMTMARGWLSAATFMPILLMARRSTDSSTQVDLTPAEDQETSKKNQWALLRGAGELALWNALCQGMINAGLASTAAARASFLIQSSVLFTPMLMLASGRAVAQHVWAGCMTAFVGLTVLSGVGTAGVATTSAVGIALGDLLCLGGAAFWSLYIFRLGVLAPRFAEIPLQAGKTAILAILYSGWALAAAFAAFAGGAATSNAAGAAASGAAAGWAAVGNLWPGWRSGSAWALLAFSAVGPGAVADLLQQVGQTAVGAAEANVILTSESLFTALTARLALGEITTTRDNIGGGIVLLAALIASGKLHSRGSKRDDNDKSK